MMCKAMNDSLSHRGPDSESVWQDPDVPLALGHRRLSIIDLSDEGQQPMTSSSGRYIVAFNGEIYNFQELAANLEAQGIAFRGRSDTEVLIEAIDYWGLNLTLQKINGMFAFALWDRKERELHFVRDPIGKKPLYVGWADQTLVFGSELKALRAHPDFKPRINRAAAAQFISLSAIQAPHCIYEGVWQLPAGHSLTLDVGHLSPGADLSTSMKPYWQALGKIRDARDRMDDRPESEIIDSFEELLMQCVQDRMISDVALGAFLSGGIDSSSIVALMQQHSTQPVKTYAIGFKEQGFNEAEHAKAVADHLGTDHHELYLGADDALTVIGDLPLIYDEPFGDVSAIPTYLVSRFAREDVSVCLSGDGGDEMLGGYNRHILASKILQATQSGPAFLRQGLAQIVRKIPTSMIDTIGGLHPQLGNKIHKASRLLGEESEDGIYANLISAGICDIVIGGSPPEMMRHKPQWDAEETDLSLAEKMMYWDIIGYLPNDILTKVDRASMAVGLEARAPLLDKRLFDFAWRLPESYKIRGRQGKWLLRQVLDRHVPSDLINRPKQGFTMPVGEWMKGTLKEWGTVALAKDKLDNQGILDSDAVHKLWDEHQRGQGNHAQILWNILMFQSWHDHWM